MSTAILTLHIETSNMKINRLKICFILFSSTCFTVLARVCEHCNTFFIKMHINWYDICDQKYEYKINI